MDEARTSDSHGDADAAVGRLCQPVLESQGYELVASEWRRGRKGATVRLFVHRPGGITVGECQTLVRLLEPKLQLEGIVDENTEFEVASPGLDRPLHTAADFTRALGHYVALRRRHGEGPHEEERLVGKVAHVDNADVVIILDAGERVAVPLSDVVEGKFDIRF